MLSRTTILDLPNELLLPILEGVVTSIKPQESIRSGIVKLSWTCRRFHQVMQYFLESTCFVGISIPGRQQENTTAPITVGKAVNISYRLLRYNTKGARGPFVKKLDMYGGYRKTYIEYQDSQKRQHITSRPSRRGRGSQGSELDISTKMLNTVYDNVIRGFKNLTIASIQNTPDSLFVHLIPGLQAILAHCPLLADLKLFLTISKEKVGDLKNTFEELVHNRVATSANLKELDILITEENLGSWEIVPKDSDDNTRDRMYPIEILGKVFGTSIASVRTLKASYIANGSGLYSLSTTDPPERWNMPALKRLQFPVTSGTTSRFLTEFCEIDYAHVQELTFSGLLDGDRGPNDDTAVAFLRQFSDLKILNIEALNPRNLPWVYFILDLNFPSFFPALKILEIRTKSYFWRDLQPAQKTKFTISLENFAIKHNNERVQIGQHEMSASAPYLTSSAEVFQFSISSRR
ncbi:uncharacterized protein DFL_003216 [Arthrobotrys flagrans]|uniref:Uncharacterized protein n=1 Tax=Arthrobotrys flagrans TaxID=97331 RepID=A0A437A161_ARTFL|nr:hypothetical protein DFL_003216 [Arthrobotrys flagrans]